MAARHDGRPGARGARLGVRLAALLLLIGVGGVAGGLIANAINGPSPSAPTSSSALSCPITRVAEDDLASVVTISATSSSGTSTGSGEIIRANGYIVTNNHVVQSVAAGGSLQVLFADGTSAAATIVGRDPQTDVAVIKTDIARSLRPIPLGSSKSVRIGEQVVALGAPLGLSSTVTSGIVSALDRTVEVPSGGSSAALLIDAIQTDAAINPGNSGGALVNCSGQLIGVPSAGASVPTSSGESSGGSIGLGFAIPVDLVTAEADEIIATGGVTHAYLGLQAEPIAPPGGAQPGAEGGLYVTSVVASGPAARAGIREGDVIATADGRAVTSTDELVALTLSNRPGTKITIGYERSGQRASTTIVLGTRA